MSDMKCDACGRFVSPSAMKRRLSTPDSHFTQETYETLCLPCALAERANTNPEVENQ